METTRLVNEIEIENNVLQKWQQEIDHRAKKSGQNVAANRTAKSAASTKKSTAANKSSMDTNSDISDVQKLIQEANEFIESESEKLCSHYNPLLKRKEWLLLQTPNKGNVYYVHDIACLVPDLKTFVCDYKSCRSNFRSSWVSNLSFAGFNGELPTQEEAQKCFWENKHPFVSKTGQINVRGAAKSAVAYREGSRYGFLYKGINVYSWGSSNAVAWLIPICRLEGKNSAIAPAKALFHWMSLGLKPASLSDISRFWGVENFCKNFKSYLLVGNNKFSLDVKKVLREVEQGKSFDFFPGLLPVVELPAKKDTAETPQETKNKAGEASQEIVASASVEEYFKNELLAWDYNRVMLDKYDAQMLLDRNRGHWELWDWVNKNAEQGTTKVKLSEGLVARNPILDVNQSGIIAIDFGTRSTVVAYEDEYGNILPLQVGNGNYANGYKKDNYENPTIMEFLHLKSFKEAYQARAGRPRTSWNDLVVSHTAMSDLQQSETSNRYGTFFTNIKQWCGDNGYAIKLHDNDGLEINLKSFESLTEDDVDPLEIYAYYLGSYINNMIQEKHIFMKYILSFPVTYEFAIRKKMLESFAAGLKKSLPTALLADENAMKQFKVLEGSSEPAAYAISALEGYDILGDSSDETEMYYAVFDFGGGTSDFDYGVFRESEDDRFDYVLTHFGAHGDKTLGGENLLRMMAFEVFKANLEKLLHPGKDNESQGSRIPFYWGSENAYFLGSESIIRNSQEAMLNMHNLMEKLRPVLEQPESEIVNNMRKSNSLQVDLFQENGSLLTKVELAVLIDRESVVENKGDDSESAKVNVVDMIPLRELLRKRIADGVDNFFNAMREAFEKNSRRDMMDKNNIVPLNQVSKIAVFLAGNASKSDLLKDLFDEYVKEDGKAWQILNIQQDSKSCARLEFELYPPLGTEAAQEVMARKNIQENSDIVWKPTGKTGVAYGLLRCRDGADVKVVDMTNGGEVLPFGFYVGRRKKRKFSVILDRNSRIGQWQKFIDAGAASFDLLYTDEAIAATNEAPATIAKRITINVDNPETDSTVYVRPVSSHAIEYVVTNDAEHLALENIPGAVHIELA